MNYSVLIIEDTVEMWRSLGRMVRAVGPQIEVSFAADYAEAVDKIDRHNYDLIVSDYYLPDFRTGMEVWSHCKLRNPQARFLLISGMAADRFLKCVDGLEHYPAFLSKPFTIEEFAIAVVSLLKDGQNVHRAA